MRKQEIIPLGSNSRLDLLIDQPSAEPVGLALCAHPHPLFGGNNTNKVIETVARTFSELGYVALRPNFRGVGQSTGQYDEGIGEQDDILSAFDWAQESWPNLPHIVLAGFSFGAYVQSHVALRLANKNKNIQQLVMVGAAVTNFTPANIPENTLLIHGAEDEVIPLADLLNWASTQNQYVNVVPNCSHFFHRRLHILKQIISRYWNRVGQ